MDSDDDEAARWAIRLENGPLVSDDQAAFDAWLAADVRRRGSLLRAEAVLAYLDRGRALAGRLEQTEPHDGAHGVLVRRRAFLIGGSLSGFAAVGALGFLAFAPRPIEINTEIGEVRRVPLVDGSIASVNTGSRVTVAMLDTRRQVKLKDGEAWFQVAHDRARPFVVEAGNVRVQAVGTAFSVRRRANGADVLVTEGVVEAWVVGQEQARTRIAAGSKSYIVNDERAIEVVEATGDIDRALAWRIGELALNGESLSYAAAELNRYNSRKIVIVDASLGREPLVGYFRTDQPENFARAVAGVTGAQVAIEGSTISLIEQPSNRRAR